MPTDRHDLEQLRRSIVMLTPGAPALDREQALRLLAELQEAEALRRELLIVLRRVLSER